MKFVWITVAILALAIGVVILLPAGTVYDPPPPPTATVGTTVIEQVAPVFESIDDPTVATPDQPKSLKPLPPELILIGKTQANVPHGVIVLPAGARLGLVRDDRQKVAAMFAGEVIEIPRDALVGVEEERPAFISTAVNFTDSMFWAPATSLAINEHEAGVVPGSDGGAEAQAETHAETAAHSKDIVLDLRNWSRKNSGTCVLEIYWIAETLARHERYVHHCEKFDLQIGGGDHVEIQSAWPDPEAKTTDKTIHAKPSSGARINGWFAVLRRDGFYLVGRGCNSEYDLLLKSTSDRDALIATSKSLHRF